MLTFAASLVVLIAVVGGSIQWAVRKERRRTSTEEGHARHH